MSGVCTPPSCASGQAMCAGVCRNLATDKANCGSCDTVCVMGHTCLEGICTGLGICGQPGTSPTQEICGDSLDNDCDGIVDESGCVKGTSTTGGTTSTGTSKCGNGVIDAVKVATGGQSHTKRVAIRTTSSASNVRLPALSSGILTERAKGENESSGGFARGARFGGRCLLPVAPHTDLLGDSLDNDCDGIVDEFGCVKGTSTTGGTTSTGTSKCGNGVIDPGERCDGDNVGSARCPPATIGGPECSLTALVSLYFVKRDDDTQSQTHHHLPLRVAGFVTE